jgi:hypothetical protein
MQKELPTHQITENEIVERIYLLRGQKVMIDKDLAEMYGVNTKVLNQAVKRNVQRFPEDFMFQLTKNEWETLRSQNVTLEEKGRGKYPKYLPKVFTEHGVAMLSSVLRSETAIQVNIQIIRVYSKMRKLLLDHKDLWRKLENIEQDIVRKDHEIKAIFKLLKQLLIQEEKPREPIGFKIPQKKTT